MKMKSLASAIGLSLLAITSLAGCNKKTETLTVWTFSNELKDIADQYYTKATGQKVKVSIKSSVTQIKTDLRNAVNRGKNIPDVVALEAAVIADFTSVSEDESYLMDLSDIDGTDDMYAYTKSVATSTDGKVLGLSWQATPGGFFYKRSIAAKLGINSPEAMQTAISTWDNYLALAEQCANYDLDESKDGKQAIAICSSILDPIKVFLSARENPWVVNNNLQTETIMFGKKEGETNCFDVVRALEQEGYSHKTQDRGSGWVTDIDSNNTLGYFCSSWGLNFDLMPNADTSFGDWAMCKAPVDYFKGGTWLASVKGCEHAESAKEFIKYVTTNVEFLTKRGSETGDFMNSKSVMSELIKDYSCAFLGGQNHLAILYEVANNINGELISPYDAVIESEFNSAVADFAQARCNNEEEVEAARTRFKASFVGAVKSDYPTIVYNPNN